MSDQSVFSNQQEEQQEQAPLAQDQPQGGNTYSDQLKSITAEDGRQKYDSVEKALEALAHSQSFIPTLQTEKSALEQELASMREELAKHKGVQEVVDSLTQHQPQGQEGNPSETQIGEEEVARIVQATLAKQEAERSVQTNTQKVNDALVSTYGDKAAEVVAQKAKELHTTPQALGELAANNPDIVLTLFKTKSSTPQLTSTSVRSDFNVQEPAPVGRPEKSLLGGATSKDQAEYMRRIREEIYRKNGITE